MECSICKKGEVIEYIRSRMLDGTVNYQYKCKKCGVDNETLVDGFLYPDDRRSDLCFFIALLQIFM